MTNFVSVTQLLSLLIYHLSTREGLQGHVDILSLEVVLYRNVEMWKCGNVEKPVVAVNVKALMIWYTEK